MRPALTLLIVSFACAACSGTEPTRDHRWFNVYQTDRSCHGSVHLPPEDPFEKGPTGRAHPF